MEQRKTSATAEAEDAALIADILAGQEFLYEKLMRKYNQRLYRVALSILNDESEIEDVMQTVYINAYLKLAGFQGKSIYSTWLTRILINECLMRKRKKQKMSELSELEEQQSFHNPLNDMMNKELKAILEKKISELPEKYRTVFMMREIEELSTKETMELLNISESNVKVRLNRAKEMLKTALSKEYKHANLFEFNLLRCDRVVKFVMSRISSSADGTSISSVRAN